MGHRTHLQGVWCASVGFRAVCVKRGAPTGPSGLAAGRTGC
ncbi:hypothetical protein roselon_00156 [Roseibacterium elongatum DSM 19469]|uniref:Uncharacterized protein n=1 Tax=Roseicyclus elongatus DSM 19469 TaxID=1294273 RepID=W8RNN1_9RHOB|nr:hypothetical protein roselon_00156 [Roseibacterium elongatum DSM 19469]